MNISVKNVHDIRLDKQDLQNIKTAEDYTTFIENMGFLFVKLLNYGDTLPLSPEEKRKLGRIARNTGTFLLREAESHEVF